MSSELINLLPRSRARAFRRGYFVRLATVALLLVALLVLLHGVLLVPTFLYARGEVARDRQQLALLDTSTQTSEEQEITARTNVLKGTVGYLTRVANVPTMSAALRAVLLVPRPGIALTGFTYTAPTGTGQPSMQLTGKADSRDALRNYVSALGQLSFVTSADLPISAYAKERDIDFTITLTGTLRP